MAHLVKKEFLGKERVYDITTGVHSFFASSHPNSAVLVHNCHQLSGAALDALLKPLEENYEGTQEKRLVCIFCTTEPEKMRATIFSRCAPAFIIQPVSPVALAQRLAMICEKEGIKFEPEMLTALAEMTECHIRDAVKAIEGISMLGDINRENVTSYMHLDLNNAYLDILDSLGVDLKKVLEIAHQVLHKTSPALCYEKLAETAMLAFQATLSSTGIPVYLDVARVKQVGQRMGVGLLGIASRLASRPHRPTEAMLLCDLGVLHHGGGAVGSNPVVIMAPQGSSTITTIPVQATTTNSLSISVPVGKLEVGPTRSGDPAILIPGTVNDSTDWGLERKKTTSLPGELSSQEFSKLLGRMVREELSRGSIGPAGLTNLGSS